MKDVECKGVKIKFLLTQSAARIVDRRAFEIRDDDFDVDDFADKLGDLHQKNLDYFYQVYPDAPIKEIYVFVTDFGAARKTSSARAIRNTLIIELDVRRWQKLYRGRDQQNAWMSAIHEFTHVVNYRTDAGENKYHRELSAIYFEMLGYVNFWGWDHFAAHYLERFALNSPQDVLEEQYTSYAPLRYLAYFFAVSFHNGNYIVAPEKRAQNFTRTAAMEQFARLYLASPKVGDAGFDEALQQVGFQTKAGQPLTISKVRQDLYNDQTL